MTLLHIVRPGEWPADEIAPTPDGFVHLSRPHQVCTPANLFYAEERGLRVLVVREIDVVVENGFPHLYRPLRRDDVVFDLPFDPDDDGVFRRLFAAADVTAPPASDFVAAMIAEMEPLYGPIDQPGTPSAGPEDFALPTGVFLVGWVAGEPVCAGGVKPLGDGVAELKRMYVAPSARGNGTGRWLLAGLETAARRLGVRVLRLDHGDKQPAAERLYASAGYVEIADYNGNPRATCWREKALT